MSISCRENSQGHNSRSVSLRAPGLHFSGVQPLWILKSPWSTLPALSFDILVWAIPYQFNDCSYWRRLAMNNTGGVVSFWTLFFLWRFCRFALCGFTAALVQNSFAPVKGAVEESFIPYWQPPLLIYKHPEGGTYGRCLLHYHVCIQ